MDKLESARQWGTNLQMSRPQKFPGLVSVKLDEPMPPHALVVENTAPASTVIARLGDLQRIVLLQLALSGTGKPDSDPSSPEKKGDRPCPLLEHP